MAGFEKVPDGISVELEEHEGDLLRQLFDEMETLLEVNIEADPINQRLFPDAYESDEDTRAYKELVGDELRSGKVAAVKEIKETLGTTGEVRRVISLEHAHTFLAALTDMRLAIGTRNDVTEEKMSEEPDPDDPEGSSMLVLHWLGWLQEMLITNLDPKEAM